jgi:hypothetical protein
MRHPIRVLFPCVDITGQRSKHLREFLDRPFDYVITV